MREDRELSQEDLASKLDLPRPSISQLESGQRDISSIELAKLAKIFEISIDDLLSPDLDEKECKIGAGRTYQGTVKFRRIPNIITNWT